MKKFFKIIFIAFGGFIALCLVAAAFSDDSTSSTDASSGEATTEEAAISPAEQNAKLKEQLKREVVSIKDFDNKAYRGDVSSIQMELVLFNLYAKIAKEGLLSEDKENQKLGQELKASLRKLQKKEFPLMRKAYVSVVKEKLWENNIDVKGIGSTTNRIAFTGTLFANNKNIKDTQGTLSEMLNMLRFKRADYKWIKYDDEYTYYDIDSFADDFVTEKTSK